VASSVSVSELGSRALLPWQCEYRLKKTAAIPAYLRRCRARAYTSIAPRATPAHLSQTCLVFSNPVRRGGRAPKFTLRLRPTTSGSCRTTQGTPPNRGDWAD